MRFPKRRADWRLGRWTAKRAVACHLGMPSLPDSFREIEIRPEPSGAPITFVSGERCPISISLSHRSATSLCAIAPSNAALGCDLELAEPRHPAFLTDYFTAQEQEFVARSPAEDQWLLMALLWSAKESALKALQIGLRIDTRSLTVQLPEARFDSPSWNPLQVSRPDGHIFHGWYLVTHDLVRTIVADPAPELPVPLCPTTSQITTANTLSRSIEVAPTCEIHAPQRQ